MVSAYVQIIELFTDREEQLKQLGEEWENAAALETTVLISSVCKDRNQPGRYLIIVTFPSYEAAQENNELPQTQKFAQQLAELCSHPPSFTDLDEIHLFENID
jgi:quinol monooxygenase YgiN